MWRSRFHSQKGSTLALAIILFLMVSILAIAAAAIAQGEIRQVVADEKSQKAYYVARSVTETTARWIEANFSNRAEIVKVVPESGADAPLTVTSDLNGVPYTLTVARSTTNSQIILIETRASVDGVGNYARMSLNETITGNLMFDHAIWTTEDLDVVNGNSHRIIDGSVASEGTISDDLNVYVYGVEEPGAIFENQPARKYQPISPPEDVDLGDPITAPDPFYIVKTTVVGNKDFAGTVIMDGTVIIDNSASDVHIRINHFRYDTLILKTMPGGTGIVYFYVTGTFTGIRNNGTDANKSKMDVINPDGTTPKVLFIYTGTGGTDDSTRTVVRGNETMTAYFYMPFTEVDLGGNPNIYGAFIVKKFNIQGNSKLYFKEIEDLSSTPFDVLRQYSLAVTVSKPTWLP